MFLAQPDSRPPCIPEFDVAVVGRSFASLRAAVRLRNELHLSVLEIDTATSASYDEIDNRWEIRRDSEIVARAKLVVDGDGQVPLKGRDDNTFDASDLTAHGFPNLFRPVHTTRTDSVGYTVRCIGHMRSHGHDYVERRLHTPIADDDYPELSFDRPVPPMWVG
ncbi:hypothetical protein [Rhodococcus sp. O3]|uniref:hypothetical protein n=1 Tax=Rhodococcus sp. O3 TaxID=3404919 RepID=UPI003B6823E2